MATKYIFNPSQITDEGPVKQPSMLDVQQIAEETPVVDPRLEESIRLSQELEKIQTTPVVEQPIVTNPVTEPVVPTQVNNDHLSFSQAFAQAREVKKAGGSKTFSWKGKIYGTDLATPTTTTTPIDNNTSNMKLSNNEVISYAKNKVIPEHVTSDDKDRILSMIDYFKTKQQVITKKSNTNKPLTIEDPLKVILYNEMRSKDGGIIINPNANTIKPYSNPYIFDNKPLISTGKSVLKKYSIKKNNK